MQVIEPGGHSGKHRHFSEEMPHILEGDGYDLHWDPQFDLDVAYKSSWSEEPKGGEPSSPSSRRVIVRVVQSTRLPRTN
jgi:hypothetical protein